MTLQTRIDRGHGGLSFFRIWRHNIDALYAGSVPIGLENLAKAISRFGLRKDDFLAVIDGVEMDARADIQAPASNELDLYCDRVACCGWTAKCSRLRHG